jgi:hypothetical protein
MKFWLNSEGTEREMMCRLFTVIALVGGLAVSDAQADPAKAEACLSELVQGAVANGMRVRATDVDSGKPEEAVNYRVTLYKGNTYILLGCADGDTVDLDLRLYNDKGEYVDGDKSPDPKPFVSVEPSVTGEYALQALVYKGPDAPTDFAVAIAFKP